MKKNGKEASDEEVARMIKVMDQLEEEELKEINS